MTDLDRINKQTQALKEETYRLAKRHDGIYYAIATMIALIALAVALK